MAELKQDLMHPLEGGLLNHPTEPSIGVYTTLVRTVMMIVNRLPGLDI